MYETCFSECWALPGWKATAAHHRPSWNPGSLSGLEFLFFVNWLLWRKGPSSHKIKQSQIYFWIPSHWSFFQTSVDSLRRPKAMSLEVSAYGNTYTFRSPSGPCLSKLLSFFPLTGILTRCTLRVVCPALDLIRLTSQEASISWSSHPWTHMYLKILWTWGDDTWLRSSAAPYVARVCVGANNLLKCYNCNASVGFVKKYMLVFFVVRLSWRDGALHVKSNIAMEILSHRYDKFYNLGIFLVPLSVLSSALSVLHRPCEMFACLQPV